MNARLKILIIAGTRPEAVKLAPVARLLRERPGFESLLCATGQHRELLAQALADFDLRPDRDLAVMTEGQSLAALSAALLTALDGLYGEENPNLVLVQGDTATAMTAALAAFYRHIPVGHVEAGLRSHDRWAPFPEEFNRRAAALLADLHFAPTETARRHLLAEGAAPEDVFVVGNTVIDALLWTAAGLGEGDELLPESLRVARASGQKIILVTAHRRETYEAAGFEGLCRGLLAVSESRPDILFVYTAHLNPKARGPVFSLLGGRRNVILLEPQPYRRFVALMKAAYLVLTDSGGLQEEAPALGKPVLVLRETTERPEGVAAGNARLVGTGAEAIAAGLLALLDDGELYSRMSRAARPYGDGRSAPRIVEILEKRFLV